MHQVLPDLLRDLGDPFPAIWDQFHLLALTPSRSPDQVPPEAVPAPLRDIEVGSGCAADYDGWLLGVAV
jgi:hypothetical protein